MQNTDGPQNGAPGNGQPDEDTAPPVDLEQVTAAPRRAPHVPADRSLTQLQTLLNPPGAEK